MGGRDDNCCFFVLAMNYPPTELVLNQEGAVFHLNLRPGDIAGTLILVGDSGRTAMIANRLTGEFTFDYKPVIDNLVNFTLDTLSMEGA